MTTTPRASRRCDGTSGIFATPARESTTSLRGADAHYGLHAQENRLAVVLTPAERALLTQTLDDWQVPEPPTCLGELERAAGRHCLAHCYQGKQREVHPHTVHSGPSGWVLRGRETGSETVKSFVVSRIADDVVIDRPGSAEVVRTVPHREFDPLRWEVDRAVEVVLPIRDDQVDEVRRSLAGAQVAVAADPEKVRMIIRVTHRAAFRSRLDTLGLGPRCRSGADRVPGHSYRRMGMAWSANDDLSRCVQLRQ